MSQSDELLKTIKRAKELKNELLQFESDVPALYKIYIRHAEEKVQTTINKLTHEVGIAIVEEEA